MKIDKQIGFNELSSSQSTTHFYDSNDGWSLVVISRIGERK